MGLIYSKTNTPSDEESDDENPINEKQMLFVERTSDPSSGSYFHYSIDRVVCNPLDMFEFYLKIGGITHLPKKKVPGKRLSTSPERLRESRYFGSYVFVADTDFKVRTLLYARKSCYPQNKLVSNAGVLHNVIPRYNGRTGQLITGMVVDRDRDINARQWTHYDDESHPSYERFKGFKEEDLPSLVTYLVAYDTTLNIVIIYVGANTSLLMVDVTQPFLHSDKCRDYNYTLFQEGGVVVCVGKPFFCFYGVEEGEEFDQNGLLAHRQYLLSDSPNLMELLERNENVCKKFVLFLKSAANHTFWTLRVNEHIREDPYDFQLCIPTGGQFENILPMAEGLAVIWRRHVRNPWHKYIQLKTSREETVKRIDRSVREPYPIDSFYNDFDFSQDFLDISAQELAPFTPNENMDF